VITKQYRGEIIELRRAGSEQALWLTADHRVLAKLRPRTLGGDNDWAGSPPKHMERRKNLRRDMTPPERVLWAALRASNWAGNSGGKAQSGRISPISKATTRAWW
jgi:adenine-specific DNA-methyltransferase